MIKQTFNLLSQILRQQHVKDQREYGRELAGGRRNCIRNLAVSNDTTCLRPRICLKMPESQSNRRIIHTLCWIRTSLTASGILHFPAKG